MSLASALENPNRIWIELETDGTNEQNHERARLASVMLKRLGVIYKTPVFWHEKKCVYCFTIDTAGTFVEAVDRGHWYNLNYFGREEENEN